MTFRDAQREAFKRTGHSQEEIDAKLAYSDSMMPEAVPLTNRELVMKPGKTEEDFIQMLVEVELKYMEYKAQQN